MRRTTEGRRTSRVVCQFGVWGNVLGGDGGDIESCSSSGMPPVLQDVSADGWGKENRGRGQGSRVVEDREGPMWSTRRWRPGNVVGRGLPPDRGRKGRKSETGRRAVPQRGYNRKFPHSGSGRYKQTKKKKKISLKKTRTTRPISRHRFRVE